MREIKFRAWNKKLQVMSEAKHLDDLYEDESMAIVSDLIWIQFTGLLDKNGKEIYEGDIVSAVFQQDYFSSDEPKNVVDVIEIELMTGMEKIYNGGPDGCEWYEDIEVIGNIYENPELLTDNQ